MNIPCFVFAGQEFDLKPEYQTIKNLFLDIFTGFISDFINFSSLNPVISIVTCQQNLYFRQYSIDIKKVNSFMPLVELQESGPFIDFIVRRFQQTSNVIMRQALRINKYTKICNISRNKVLGNIGRLHINLQDLYEASTANIKGTKRKQYFT